MIGGIISSNHPSSLTKKDGFDRWMVDGGWWMMDDG
jgi:hypothetical protein